MMKISVDLILLSELTSHHLLMLQILMLSIGLQNALRLMVRLRVKQELAASRQVRRPMEGRQERVTGRTNPTDHRLLGRHRS